MEEFIWLSIWLFLGYCLVSTIFLFFPMFFIKKNPNKIIKHLLNSKPFYVIGHRGGLREVPENTTEGVELCL